MRCQKSVRNARKFSSTSLCFTIQWVQPCHLMCFTDKWKRIRHGGHWFLSDTHVNTRNKINLLNPDSSYWTLTPQILMSTSTSCSKTVLQCSFFLKDLVVLVDIQVERAASLFVVVTVVVMWRHVCSTKLRTIAAVLKTSGKYQELGLYNFWKSPQVKSP